MHIIQRNTMFQFKNNIKEKLVYLIIFLLAVIITVVIFFSFFKKEEEKKQEYISGMELFNSDIFVFDGKTVQGKEMTIKIPEEWIEKRDSTKISFYSPDINLENENLKLESLKNGACGIIFQIGKIKENDAGEPTIAEYIQMMINSAEYKDVMNETENLKHEIFFINGQKGLKTIFNLEKASYIILEIPSFDKVYIIESDFIFSDNCREKFDEILSSISL